METLGLLMEGFAGALTPMNLLWVVLGCLLGTAVGVMPGLGSSMAVALLLPMTFALDPTAAFIMFSGVYFGGLFGDSTMAILMNTPGQASAIAFSSAMSWPSTAEPKPNQPGSMTRDCDQLNTHGMARRSSILGDAVREEGREPILRSAISAIGVAAR